MKPIRLTMTAFGPYAGTEEIDFRDAIDAGLFGIYGPTGSGKSSIFSAMTFALFGEGAKKEQSIATMRSQHADPDQVTEVSLLFEVGARRYLVRRQPDQARPKKRGDGETFDSHAAWLFDVTEIPVEDVTTEHCGIVLAERKVGEVLKHVRALLGYGVEQFRQIVLLPQGRFERFLVANSDERVGILRELFDVSLYRNLTKRMKDGALSAKREFEDGHRIVAQRLVQGGFASTEALVDGIALAAEDLELQEQAARDAERGARDAEKAHLAAESLEAKFVAAENADKHRLVLEEQRASTDAARVSLEQAEKAQRAIDLEARLAEAGQLRNRAVEVETKARKASIDAGREHEKSEMAYEATRKRAAGIDALLVRASELERHCQSLLDAVDLKEQHDSKVTNLASAQTAFNNADAERMRLDALCTDFAGQIEVVRRSDLRRATLTARRTEVVSELRAARAHIDASSKVEVAIAQLDGAAKKRDQTAALVAPAQESVIAAEGALIGAQAQLLARMHLVDGEPCPVCGSADHPAPAHGEDDPRRLEKDLTEARKRCDQILRDANVAEGAIAPAKALVTERKEMLAALPAPERSAEDIEDEGTQLKAELEALGEAIDIAPLEGKAAAAKRLLSDVETGTLAARDTLNQAKTDEAVAARSYQDATASVPKPLRAEGAIEEAVETVSIEIEQLRGDLTLADEHRKGTATARDTVTAQLNGAIEAVKATEEEVERVRGAFETRLKEVGLAADEYLAGREQIPQIAMLAERIQKFRHDVAMAASKLAEANEAICGLERPDVKAAGDSRDAAQAEALSARGAAAKAAADHKVLLDLRTSLLDQLRQLEKLERDTGPLRELADAFAGDNAMRTPLETFAIGAMFDHVLDAANLRLSPMTGGRYRFERDVESIGGRSKRGLDVRVHDIETGRAREISTLSGGETFIAALSLALGLSDIVEMNHGQIRLDTIFIDEGFGSLDTENDGGTLDLVLQVLQEIVGKRRAVGLISHVPMVQQAVPNGFSVVKAVGGSRIERRVA